jgi:phage gp45-like
MEQSQYYHFLSRAQDGAEAVVLPVGDHDRMIKIFIYITKVRL